MFKNPFPLMKGFFNKGVSNGSVAVFLYARGIKLSLLPMLAVYFGFKYMLALTIAMFFSFMQGILVDVFMGKSSKLSE